MNREKKRKAYCIAVTSLKGGVGKTTISVNLASALSTIGHKVLLVDGSIYNPGIALALGIEDNAEGLRKIMKEGNLKESVISDKRTGLDLLLVDKPMLTVKIAKPNIVRLLDKVKDSYEFVIIDVPHNIPMDMLFRFIDEIMITATPDMPAVAHLPKLYSILRRKRIRSGLIMNAVERRGYDLDYNTIRESTGIDPLGELPRDENVYRCAMDGTPVVLKYRNSPFSVGIYRIAKAVERRQKI
jgi:septum site-determining protein MinD